MKEERKQVYQKEVDEIITIDKVKHLGELLAFSTLKIIMRYSGRALDDLYYGLIRDLNRAGDINRPLSDGYDIAQTAICFLCGYIGMSLSDDSEYYRNGKAKSIRYACYSAIGNYIFKERIRIYTNICIDDLKECDEPVAPTGNEALSDYTVADKMITKMELTTGQEETLSCYMSGLSFVETARILEVNNTTVWRRMNQVRKKYFEKLSPAYF